MAQNVPAPKGPAKLATRSYVGDPIFVSSGPGKAPSTTVNNLGQRSARRQSRNAAPSAPKVKNSGVVKA